MIQKFQVQSNKQTLSSLSHRTQGRTVEPYRIPNTSSPSKINAKWTQEEQLLGVQGKIFASFLSIFYQTLLHFAHFCPIRGLFGSNTDPDFIQLQQFFSEI